jgi:hypothetical protein
MVRAAARRVPFGSFARHRRRSACVVVGPFSDDGKRPRVLPSRRAREKLLTSHSAVGLSSSLLGCGETAR